MLQMSASLRILDLTLCFKLFIEVNHKDRILLRMLTYATLGETKFVQLEKNEKRRRIIHIIS